MELIKVIVKNTLKNVDMSMSTYSPLPQKQKKLLENVIVPIKSSIFAPKTQIIVMMKKLMMMAIVMMATVQTHAQLEEGEWSIIPKVGVNIADLTGKLFDATKAEGSYDATLHPLVTVAAGAEGEYGITEQWGFVLGIN
jgi:hypothetical protein